ncbi:hypothetical protein BC938DRAFT_476213 [Jimgerdemannia flammicorona]|uniref:DUF4833 domain-containing protein n=1 Tax=Jimgerdemannia flammicorona TaxID=994334 RepID=A0A433QQT7_9FUNG|nr:hypothetical protein BC938DRAFT_476213 [Jimgerdemannia flammicorona]
MRPTIIASIYLLLLLALLTPAAHADPNDSTNVTVPTHHNVTHHNVTVTMPTNITGLPITCPLPTWTAKFKPNNDFRLTAAFSRESAYVNETSLYDTTTTHYSKRLSELRSKGWLLHILRERVVDNKVYYTAVWRLTGENHTEVYGFEKADFLVKIKGLRQQGWRIDILNQYVLDNKVYYTAVLRKSNIDDVQGIPSLQILQGLRNVI